MPHAYRVGMLRDPSLTPEPWRGRRRLRVHPLLVVPVAAAVALALTVTRVLAHHARADWVVLGYATAAALASTACLPWHLPQRPVNDPRNHTITFGSRRRLGALPLGLVLCGAVLVVHFELMRTAALPRSGESGAPWSVPWWLTLPLGLVLLGVGLSVTRPAPTRLLTVSPTGLVLRDGRRGFTVRWEQLRRLVPVLERRGHRVIELDAPGIEVHDRHGRAAAPRVR